MLPQCTDLPSSPPSHCPCCGVPSPFGPLVELRKCKTCGIVKPLLTNYEDHGKNGRRADCHECRGAKRRRTALRAQRRKRSLSAVDDVRLLEKAKTAGLLSEAMINLDRQLASEGISLADWVLSTYESATGRDHLRTRRRLLEVLIEARSLAAGELSALADLL